MNKAKKVRLLLTACQLDNETWIKQRRWGFLLPHLWKQWIDHAQWKGFPKFIECLTDESIKEGNVWLQTTNEIHKCKSNWGVSVLQGVEILELLLNPLVEWIAVTILLGNLSGRFPFSFLYLRRIIDFMDLLQQSICLSVQLVCVHWDHFYLWYITLSSVYA